MILLRAFLVLFLAILSAYTVVVIINHGINLFPYFFGDMLAMSWAGQFNLDFLGFLVLSAAWVMWRNRFTPSGILLGVVAFFGGMGFLTVYLLYLSFAEQGDMSRMLLGSESVDRS